MDNFNLRKYLTEGRLLKENKKDTNKVSKLVLQAYHLANPKGSYKVIEPDYDDFTITDGKEVEDNYLITKKGDIAFYLNLSDNIKIGSIYNTPEEISKGVKKVMKYNKKIKQKGLFEDMDPDMEKSIIKYVDENSYFDLYGAEDGEILFNTRENGSVGDEEPGYEDIKHARDLKKKLHNTFDRLKVKIETVDEWVHLRVYPKVPKVDQFEYTFKKWHEDGSGFSSSFDSLEELIKKYGDWVNVDWDEIKSKVDKINHFPNDSFTGWYESYPLLIKSKKDEDNDWGYNFSIIKSKKNG